MAFDLTPVNRRAIGLGLLASVVGLAALQYAVTRHGPVRPDEPPTPGAHRIVSLVPAVTEMLFAIGAGDRLVAVSSFDTFPPEVQGLTRVGALLDPDLERIFALQPDLVVLYATHDELRSQLARAGIAAYVYQHGGLAEIPAMMRDLGARTRTRERAERAAANLERELQAVADRVGGLPRPATLVVIGRERGSLRGIYASGGRGFLHDLVNLAGGRDVLADIDRENVQASTELLLARSPEVILEVYGGNVMSQSDVATEKTVWQKLSSIPAVRDGRVHILTGQELVVPGPRIARAAERFARVLHPDAFEDAGGSNN